MLFQNRTSNLAERRILADQKAKAVRIAQDEKAKREAAAWRERNTPLPARLKKWLDSLPESVRYAGLTMEIARENLSGKFRGKAAAPQIGIALRQMGYVRVRIWRGESIGHISLWFPPDAPESVPRRPRGYAKSW
ncbi:hypothetical protein [Undibacterium griseum]|uniref:Uncharacterized protein n=1 Tax=Undibacterium griseum TaxID=2762295 RepID=A0ABR6YQZ7_9BURK|nr:hypothetical protein [Undibacterium griseum]MBC3886319.1 hypothetical protein [Undibacterium griseum]